MNLRIPLSVFALVAMPSLAQLRRPRQLSEELPRDEQPSDGNEDSSGRRVQRFFSPKVVGGGHYCDIRGGISLVEDIADKGIQVRNQGNRGTCSVFAITFLLEYLLTQVFPGYHTDLSEEYLNYVTNLVKGGTHRDGDFFHHIINGYRAYGIVSENAVPYRTSPVSHISTSTLNQGRQLISDTIVPVFLKEWDLGGVSDAQIERAIDWLDEDVPIALGTRWPNTYRTQWRAGINLMEVPANDSMVHDGHSVVLVGYMRNSCAPGGGYFTFRNSYGSSWGSDGYGYIPFEYVKQYGNDMVLYYYRGPR